jgi:hypothetical protein
MDMQHREAALTFTFDMQQGRAVRKCRSAEVDIKHGHAARACSRFSPQNPLIFCLFSNLADKRKWDLGLS